MSMKQASLSSHDLAEALCARMLASFGCIVWADCACSKVPIILLNITITALWPHWCIFGSVLNERGGKKKLRLATHHCCMRPQQYGSEQLSKCAQAMIEKDGGKMRLSWERGPPWRLARLSSCHKVKSECKQRCSVFSSMVYLKSRFWNILSSVQHLFEIRGEKHKSWHHEGKNVSTYPIFRNISVQLNEDLLHIHKYYIS